MRRFALLVALVLLPSAAHAGEIEINFDLTGTSVSALGGALSIPPAGTISAASWKITVPGTGSVTPSGGAATFESLTIDATIGTNILGASITGFLVASQVGTGMGTLNPALSLLQIQPVFFLDVDIFADCSGFGCIFLPDVFPISLNGTQTLNTVLGVAASGLSTLGNAMLSGTLTFTFNTITATVMLVGTEVSRTFLPEPTQLVQLGAGGLALLALGLVSRRRR